MKQPHTGDSLNAAVLAFRRGFRTVLLATASRDGEPESSYAPYIADDDGNIWIFISQLARHTSNLLNHPQAGLLFIADERDSPNPFARRRLRYRCEAQEFDRDGVEGAAALRQLEQEFGAIVRTLRELPDFHLFRLSPRQGSYIEGFGAAWNWSGALPPAGDTPAAPATGGG